MRFTGALSGDRLSEAYQRCSIFAMPARTELQGDTPEGEGFGIVFLEAMAHGKPVVGPRDGAPRSCIVLGEHGLLVDPSDRAEIAQAIIGLLEDPERRRRMGENARAWVAREFTRRTSSRAYGRRCSTNDKAVNIGEGGLSGSGSAGPPGPRYGRM